MEAPYLPIDCGVHDLLEEAAVRRDLIAVTFRDGGTERTLLTRVEDVFARESEEFVRLEGEAEPVRLDRLIRVGETAVAPAEGACSIA